MMELKLLPSETILVVITVQAQTQNGSKTAVLWIHFISDGKSIDALRNHKNKTDAMNKKETLASVSLLSVMSFLGISPNDSYP